MNRFQRSEICSLFRRSIKNKSFDYVLDTYRYLFEDTDNAKCLSLWIMLKYGEYEQYLSYDCNPNNFLSSREFYKVYQCAKLFSKYPYLKTGIDTKRVAVVEFIRCEAKCRSINRAVFDHGFRKLFKSPDEWQVIHLATRKIARILGPIPRLDDLTFHFGPGQNVGLAKTTNVYSKLMSSRTVTKGLLAFLQDNPVIHPAWDCASDEEVPSVPYYSLSTYKTVPGSKLAFVPKNAKTDRPICIEPLYNSFIQTGLGSYMRDRLRYHGVDLRDQTVNQRLAKLGSLGDSLATVDMKSASDLISYSVVMEMLPFDWFLALDASRSPSFSYEGREYELEKFSSMGNGYTFELETLVFHSIAESCVDLLGLHGDSEWNCYGDDVIIPSRAYDLFSRTLESLGFEINHSKSYRRGPFRESCGKDFFNGALVRPLFLKKYLSPEVIYSQMNFMYRSGGWSFEDPLFHRTWKLLLELLPRKFHLFGPNGYGDGHIVIEYENLPRISHPYRRRQFEGLAFYSFRAEPIQSVVSGPHDYCYALYNADKAVRTVDGFLEIRVTNRARTKVRLTKMYKPRTFCQEGRKTRPELLIRT